MELDLQKMSKILKLAGVSDPGDHLPEGMSIRQVTLEDRDAVIQVHDNVKEGTDRLPAYYNYWLSLPEVYAVGLYDGEKMDIFCLTCSANPRIGFLMTRRIYPQVGFVFAMAVDDGTTTVIRMTRLNPVYQGRYLHRLMSRHVSIRQVMYKGAKSVVSTEEDVGPHKNSVLPRYTEKAFHSWEFVQLKLNRRDFERFQADDKLVTVNLEVVSDTILAEFFQNVCIREYIAPKGVLMVHSVPLKPIASNIPFVRGLKDSTIIYSDLTLIGSECRGLLSCSSRYTTPHRGRVNYVFKLDVFGDDPLSFRKHFIRHLQDMTKCADDAFALNITLPDGFKLDEIGRVLNDYKVEIDEWRLDKATCSKVRLLQFWPR